jgi:outer membrane lipoprotein-sorting protein
MNKFLLIVLFILIPFQSFSQESQLQKDLTDKKDEIFARIKLASSEVKTLAGDFTQEKHLEILENAPVSKGKFYYQNPDSLRWEIYEPVVMGFIVKGDKGKKWQGKTGSKLAFNLKNEPVIKIITDQIFAWSRADFNWLETRYSITVQDWNPVELKLVPISVTEKKYIDYIRLVFSLSENYVKAIEIREIGGDSTEIKFIEMTVNEPIEKDIF